MIPFYVALGGAAGSLLRFGLTNWIQARAWSGFPWGTFAVNGIGSLFIGVMLGVLVGIEAGPGPRALLVMGLLGGFTTFSTFSYETLTLLQNDSWGKAFAYAGGSVLIGVGAVFLGLQVAEFFLRGR